MLEIQVSVLVLRERRRATADAASAGAHARRPQDGTRAARLGQELGAAVHGGDEDGGVFAGACASGDAVRVVAW